MNSTKFRFREHKTWSQLHTYIHICAYTYIHICVCMCIYTYILINFKSLEFSPFNQSTSEALHQYPPLFLCCIFPQGLHEQNKKQGQIYSKLINPEQYRFNNSSLWRGLGIEENVFTWEDTNMRCLHSFWFMKEFCQYFSFVLIFQTQGGSSSWSCKMKLVGRNIVPTPKKLFHCSNYKT